MTAKIILNPYANRWRSGAQQADLEQALKNAGVDYDLAITQQAGDGFRLASEALSSGFDPIISAGGDGSMNDVINGIMQAAGKQTLPRFGLIPLGTANDLVDNLGMPKEIQESVNIIAAGKTRMLDLCKVNERYFLNNAGIGFEPMVTLTQQRMTRTQGILRYLLAVLRVIAQNPQWDMQLEWDTGSYSGPVTLVSIGNFARTGGIFYTVPHADGFDGKLSFVYGHVPGRMGILGLLPKTMKPAEGNYVEHPAVHEIHSSFLRVRMQPTSPAHADGELFTSAAHELNYSIEPAKLPILLPH